MGWSQRLRADHYTEVQEQVRRAADADGLDAVLLDDPEDVAYLTGFFHHPTERPVAVLLGTDGTTVLLLPELEREYAEAQRAVADIVSYPEYPGVVPPFDVLAGMVAVHESLVLPDPPVLTRLGQGVLDETTGEIADPRRHAAAV